MGDQSVVWPGKRGKQSVERAAELSAAVIQCACVACEGVVLEMFSASSGRLVSGLSLTQRTARHSGRRWLAFKKSDDPITFSQSGARTFRIVDDAIMSGAGEQKRGRFAVPLGLLSFAALVYLGFIRDETTNTTDLLQPPEHLQQRGIIIITVSNL